MRALHLIVFFFFMGLSDLVIAASIFPCKGTGYLVVSGELEKTFDRTDAPLLHQKLSAALAKQEGVKTVEYEFLDSIQTIRVVAISSGNTSEGAVLSEAARSVQQEVRQFREGLIAKLASLGAKGSLQVLVLTNQYVGLAGFLASGTAAGYLFGNYIGLPPLLVGMTTVGGFGAGIVGRSVVEYVSAVSSMLLHGFRKYFALPRRVGIKEPNPIIVVETPEEAQELARVLDNAEFGESVMAGYRRSVWYDANGERDSTGGI